MNRIISKKSKKIKPSRHYPELMERLVAISILSYELYQLTKPEEIGRVIGIKRQSFQQHIDKKKKGAKRENV